MAVLTEQQVLELGSTTLASLGTIPVLYQNSTGDCYLQTPAGLVLLGSYEELTHPEMDVDNLMGFKSKRDWTDMVEFQKMLNRPDAPAIITDRSLAKFGFTLLVDIVVFKKYPSYLRSLVEIMDALRLINKASVSSASNDTDLRFVWNNLTNQLMAHAPILDHMHIRTGVEVQYAGKISISENYNNAVMSQIQQLLQDVDLIAREIPCCLEDNPLITYQSALGLLWDGEE